MSQKIFFSSTYLLIYLSITPGVNGGVFFGGDSINYGCGMSGPGGGSGGGMLMMTALSGGVPFGSNITSSEVTSWWSTPSEPAALAAAAGEDTQEWL